MDKITKRFFQFFFVIFLTFLTQVGGIIWLICYPTFHQIKERIPVLWHRISLQILFFITIYMGICSTFVPFFAQKLGREPLPFFGNEHLKPLNLMTCVMNRHYVTPLLKKTLEQSAIEFEEMYPMGIITYLDANFPFITGFPLLPHHSHNDGEKVDIAFFYLNTHSQLPMYGKSITSFGYGVFEEPKANEINMTQRCKNKGAWQYDILKFFSTNRKRDKMVFDEERTKALILIFNDKKNIQKLFLEPHLKTRLGLEMYDKIRFHGCKAVRHDDHLHIQL